ncbi:DUF1800 domain-containing protein [Flavobacterium terrisoli]|uniref:DUF1800 domain-containing protein n=1 Tax=Flavobacterium terrisoli TaxID=3242195 RepID=UPI002542D323|nr:DUF1800 domain-containing protein [Flavobacterium buctense]
MNKNTLWSLRLGFSSKQSKQLDALGMNQFLERSFALKFEDTIPSFLENSPKSLKELKAKRQAIKNESPENVKKMLREEAGVSQEMKAWWLEKMKEDEFPLREKMTCFWHNHFVSTFQKVKVNHWVFQHNQILRKNAFGNFKTITKEIIQSNAMVRYLDNVDNKRNDVNENLSRELLELFTLGIGNYTEEDIKNGAKGLAGLNIGENRAVYRPPLENNESMVYFGQTGKFKANEMIDIIFEQKAAPYLLTRKMLKWFIYDNPSEDLVIYYGDYFRKMDFEIKPLLQKIFTEEYAKDTAGSKIKDPLVYILQLMHELKAEQINPKLVAFFLRQQGMDLFNQPNVKGWNGGKEWLTSQIFLQRNNTADLLCNGRGLRRKKQFPDEIGDYVSTDMMPVSIDWKKTGNNKTIIADLAERLLFKVDANLQKDFEEILKYDFDPKTESAANAVLRLFNAMVKTPEYQLI